MNSMPMPSMKNKMSRRQKKRRLSDGQSDDNNNNHDHLVTLDALSTDELALIFEYLSPEKIMLARLNKKMRDAATKTVVPMDSDINNAFHVDSVRKYHAMASMVTSLPNLQQIVIGIRDSNNHPTTFKYNDGEDPDAQIAAFFANRTTHDIGILSNFTKLRELEIYRALLNGRYPMLFNFPLLQKLHIDTVLALKWDLEMLAGLPSLEELIIKSQKVTGNIRSLRVLKDTLSKIDIRYGGIWGNVMDLADFLQLKCLTLVYCQARELLEIDHSQKVRGDFMNLSHLPHLKVLNLAQTAVTGDIRDIGNDDFPSLESLYLPPDVYGGCGFQFQSISEGFDVIAAVSTILKQHRNLHLKDWYAKLSDDSPERYEAIEEYDELELYPPLTIRFVKAGSRLGWRWIGDDEYWTEDDGKDLSHCCCEINWVDLEPSKKSDHYEQYIQEKAKLEENLDAYEGYYEPPDEEEYHRICSEEYKILNMRL